MRIRRKLLLALAAPLVATLTAAALVVPTLQPAYAASLVEVTLRSGDCMRAVGLNHGWRDARVRTQETATDSIVKGGDGGRAKGRVNESDKVGVRSGGDDCVETGRVVGCLGGRRREHSCG